MAGLVSGDCHNKGLVVRRKIHRRRKRGDIDVVAASSNLKRRPSVYCAVISSPVVDDPLLRWELEEVHHLSLVGDPFRLRLCANSPGNGFKLRFETLQVSVHLDVLHSGECSEKQADRKERQANDCAYGVFKNGWHATVVGLCGLRKC